MVDHLLTLWAVRLSLVCYAIVLASRLGRRQSGELRNFERAVWTLGCVLLVGHIAGAFHFRHGWSHAHAVAETARQTRDLLGREFGGGVYFNYLFAAAWTADVGWMWLSRASYERRPAWVAAALHAYLMFIAVNGAIVFERGPTRWFGVAACIGLAVLAVQKIRLQQPFRGADAKN